jgi:hypothetical protein
VGRLIPLTAVAGLALAVTLAGCTAGAPQPEAAWQETAAAAALPSELPQPTNVPTAVTNTPALRHEVSLLACARSHGGWEASGTASNAGKSSVAYTVTIFFTTDHGTVVGLSSTKVTVKPAGNEHWSVRTDLPATADLRCVLRGVG